MVTPTHTPDYAAPMTSRLSLAALALWASLGTACGVKIEHGTVKLATPPHSGETEIDMRGLWVTTEVTHLSTPTGRAPAPTYSDPPPGSLFPPSPGLQVELDAETILKMGGFDVSLSALTQPGGEAVYINHSDGKVARLSFRRYPSPASTQPDIILEVILGAVDEQTMLGYVFYTGIFSPQGHRPPDGLFSFSLLREASGPSRIAPPEPDPDLEADLQRVFFREIASQPAGHEDEATDLSTELGR